MQYDRHATHVVLAVLKADDKSHASYSCDFMRSLVVVPHRIRSVYLILRIIVKQKRKRAGILAKPLHGALQPFLWLWLDGGG